VKAAAFDYARVETVETALGLLAANPQAKLLAGGQSLLPALNLRLSQPNLLIDISRIPSLRGISLDGGVLRIGALARHAEVMASPMVAEAAPLLARALVHVAHPAIRSRGTFGGSLANADPAAELPACALALQARIVAQSPRGERIIMADHFFTGLFETALAPDEMLIAVEIDAARIGDVAGFQELARRSGDYAIVGLAAQGTVVQGQFTALRLGWFSVGTRATLSTHAAAALIGRDLADALTEAEAALARDLEPHDDQIASSATRLRLAGVLLRRVVAEMLG
jgi:carbon-monoxide dehydrogenase medium subunit